MLARSRARNTDKEFTIGSNKEMQTVLDDEAEQFIFNLMGWNTRQVELLREYCNTRKLTILQVLEKGAKHFLNGTIDSEFMGFDESRRLRQMFNHAFSD